MLACLVYLSVFTGTVPIQVMEKKWCFTSGLEYLADCLNIQTSFLLLFSKPVEDNNKRVVDPERQQATSTFV